MNAQKSLQKMGMRSIFFFLPRKLNKKITKINIAALKKCRDSPLSAQNNARSIDLRHVTLSHGSSSETNSARTYEHGVSDYIADMSHFGCLQTELLTYSIT